MASLGFFHRLGQKLFGTTVDWPLRSCVIGDHRLELLGSIHMGVAAMAPLPKPLLATLRHCDGLIVEADITQPATFSTPVLTAPQPLEQRFTALLLAKLHEYCRECRINPKQLTSLPAWQIALMLQQQQAYLLGLRSEYGIDHQLIDSARQQQKAVICLESAEQQHALLTSLPNHGLALLEDTLFQWRTNARLLQQMINWWLAKSRHPLHQLPLSSTFSHELGQHLIVQRNRQWCDQLLALPAGRYLVAVGALHLVGSDNLFNLLQQALLRESS